VPLAGRAVDDAPAYGADTIRNAAALQKSSLCLM